MAKQGGQLDEGLHERIRLAILADPEASDYAISLSVPCSKLPVGKRRRLMVAAGELPQHHLGRYRKSHSSASGGRILLSDGRTVTELVFMEMIRSGEAPTLEVDERYLPVAEQGVSRHPPPTKPVVRFGCPSPKCGATLRVPFDRANFGRTGLCPNCRVAVPVPLPG